MTRWLLVLALVGCGGGAKTLHVPTDIARVGEASVVDQRMTSKTKLHVEDVVVESTVIVHKRSHRRVVELEGALVVRTAVRYETDETITIDGEGNQTTAQGPTVGKSYEVWRDRDALEAEHADGSPITAEERSALNSDFRRLGTTSQAEAFITGRVWRRDEAVPLDDVTLADLAASLPDDMDVREASIAWSGVDGGVATFRARFQFTSPEGFAVQMTMDARMDRKTGRMLGKTGQALSHGRLKGYDVEQTMEFVTTIGAE